MHRPGQKGRTLSGQLTAVLLKLPCPLAHHRLTVRWGDSLHVDDLVRPWYSTKGAPHREVFPLDLHHWGGGGVSGEIPLDGKDMPIC